MQKVHSVCKLKTLLGAHLKLGKLALTHCTNICIWYLVFVFAIRTRWVRRKLLHFTFRSLLTFANICCVFIGVLSSYVCADCVRAATFCANIKIQLVFLAAKSEI